MIADLKFALRQLGKSPGFTFVVVLTLALGIGINVAMYSVIHAVLLSELPFPEADRLVAISEAWRENISPHRIRITWTGKLRSILSRRSQSHAVMTST